MRRVITLCLTLFSLVTSSLLHADKALTQRKDVQNFINTMVVKHGFNRQELTQTMSAATIQPQIIESMNKPYEKKPWDVYKQLFFPRN